MGVPTRIAEILTKGCEELEESKNFQEHRISILDSIRRYLIPDPNDQDVLNVRLYKLIDKVYYSPYMTKNKTNYKKALIPLYKLRDVFVLYRQELEVDFAGRSDLRKYYNTIYEYIYGDTINIYEGEFHEEIQI